ncbi:MAG: PepSY domain-containing protein, partial [Planctomycetota bacterium]
ALIAATGLLYSLGNGSVYHGTAIATGQYDLLMDPPQSAVPEGVGGEDHDEVAAQSITPDAALAAALVEERTDPPARISMDFPHLPADAYAVWIGGHYGPSVNRVVHIDRYTGAVVNDARIGDLGPMAQWTQWNYPLHVGSVGGLTTKILWSVAALGVCCLPLTGMIMWLIRRNRGTAGFPKHYKLPGGGWTTAGIIAMGVLLPTVGLSLLLMWAGVGAAELFRRFSGRSQPLAA